MTKIRRGRGRGEIAERGPGRYLVRVFIGVDPLSGRRLRVSQTVRGTKAEAQRVLTDLLSKQDRGAPLPVSRMTLGAWLDEFEKVWATALAPQTRENATQTLRCYVPMALRSTRLTSLRAGHFQSLYNDMATRRLAPATIGGLHRILKARLGKACKLGHLAANPLDAASPPSIQRREYRVLSPAEARVFLDEVARDDYAALWTLLLLTGLRPAEALGLKWEDLEGDRLAIRRALVRLAGGDWQLGETKTRKARTVRLPGPAIRAIQRHRARQAEARLRLGSEYTNHGLMFAGVFGQPLRWENVVRRHFEPTLARTARRLLGRSVLALPKRGLRRATRRSWAAKWAQLEQAALEATGLARMRPYDLRHSAATLLLAAGEHPKVVAELLGHAKVTLTLDTYSHVSPTLLDQAARRMEEIVRGDSTSPGRASW